MVFSANARQVSPLSLSLSLIFQVWISLLIIWFIFVHFHLIPCHSLYFTNILFLFGLNKSFGVLMSYIYVCVYACVCAHICICVYMYIYVCVSIYIYICVYIYVYTHTYIWLKNYLIYNLSLFLSFGVLIHFYKIANGKSCRWSVFVDCGFLSVYKVIILLSLISFLHSYVSLDMSVTVFF